MIDSNVMGGTLGFGSWIFCSSKIKRESMGRHSPRLSGSSSGISSTVAFFLPFLFLPFLAPIGDGADCCCKFGVTGFAFTAGKGVMPFGDGFWTLAGLGRLCVTDLSLAEVASVEN